MSDLLQHWNLTTKPFEATWDTRFYYRSSQHQEALERLFYLAHEGTMNIGMLTGEIGCGKTITRAVLRMALCTNEFLVVSCENSGFAFEDLLEAILRQIDPYTPSVPEGKFARCERLREVCEASAARGRHVIVMLDEAQEMPPETLRQLGCLTNFNGDGRALLTLILIGQPSLRPLISSSQAIQQRVGLRFHLNALNEADTAGYVRHRLKAAGHANGEVFTQEALPYLHVFSRGIPREINRSAKLCMEHAWAAGSETVTLTHLHEVACDIYRQDNLIPAAVALAAVS